MNGWQRYASFERKQRRERCVLCMIAGGIIAVVLFMVIPAFAHGGRTTDELYTDHKANLHQCFYSNPSRAGVVACSDPAANPCTAGVFCVPEEDRCHTHSAELMLGGKTQACIDFETPPPPPPVVVPPPVVIPPATDRHSDDHPRCDGASTRKPTTLAARVMIKTALVGGGEAIGIQQSARTRSLRM